MSICRTCKKDFKEEPKNKYKHYCSDICYKIKLYDIGYLGMFFRWIGVFKW